MTVHGRPLHRRKFLRTAGAGLVVLPHVGLARFLSIAPARKARIALVRTSDRKDGVARALALLGPAGLSGKRVLLKPNFNSAGEAPASTHNDTLSQLIHELHERGAREITLGESSGPPATRDVMERKGIFDLASDLDFGVVNYEEIPEADWLHFGASGTHWPDGFWLPRQVVNAEYNVSTCCLKTHGFGGVFTMSLKLSVGLTPKRIRRTLHRSPDMRRMIAELNAGYRPQLIVLDGVVAFSDGGPSDGELKQANVIVAGDDRVAVDAVGLAVLKELGSNEAIMGRGIFEQEQMARAVELGLGITGPEQIEFLTPDEASRAYAEKLEEILTLG